MAFFQFQRLYTVKRIGKTVINIQNITGGKVNILGGHSIDHSKQKKKVRDRAISLYSTPYTV
jgi:hypothetical protein